MASRIHEDTPATVVIVGGGLAGRMVAMALLKEKVAVKVVVVQANDFVEWNWAGPELLCDPSRQMEFTAANPATFALRGVQYIYRDGRSRCGR